MTEGTRRLLDVTAYTTLDFVDARVQSHDWTDTAVGVLDVTDAEAGTEASRDVTLSLELDGEAVEELPRHAVRLDLSVEQARTLATALTDAASEAERDP